MKGNRVKNSNTISSNRNSTPSTNISNARNNFSKTEINSSNNLNNPQDDYITNLQKQVYYLELEMKLMKDKEIDTKNKVGGYEILFRDGVPLNEHFLALKTKYTNEKDQFEKYISEINSDIYNIENENKYIQQQLEESNRNYYEII